MGLSACAIKSDRLGLAGFAGAAAGVKNETDYSFVQANQIARADAIDTFQFTNLRTFKAPRLLPGSRRWYTFKTWPLPNIVGAAGCDSPIDHFVMHAVEEQLGRHTYEKSDAFRSARQNRTSVHA